MRIFVIGDYRTGTGPANVTWELIKALKKTDNKILFQRFTGKIMRLIELYIKIPMSDVCLMSGYSGQNLHAIRIAHSLGKRCVYLMHGCVEHENSINRVPDDRMTKIERQTLDGSDLILAVSNEFEKWLKDNYSEYADKIKCLTNGVNWEEQHDYVLDSQNIYGQGEIRVISVGGGMPRKRITYICDAIEQINNEGVRCKLVVAGASGADTDKIAGYKNTVDLGLISKDRLTEEYRKSHIFVQNSCFETFGLAPIEALLNGNSILLSKNVGALSLFQRDALRESDIIYDTENCHEIADKIKNLINIPNNERLIKGLDKENTSWESVSSRLLNILRQVKEEK